LEIYLDSLVLFGVLELLLSLLLPLVPLGELPELLLLRKVLLLRLTLLVS